MYVLVGHAQECHAEFRYIHHLGQMYITKSDRSDAFRYPRLRKICSWSAGPSQLGYYKHQTVAILQTPPQLRCKIYITTTLPKLEYCSAVWDPHHVKRRQQLENVQKFAGRVITNNWTSGYELLCSSLGLMKLADRRRTQKLKLCYKIVNNLSCIPSFTLFPHPYPSPWAPNSKQLSLPLARTEAHEQSFFVNVVFLWNALPEAIVSAPSPCIFKHHLYKLYSV